MDHGDPVALKSLIDPLSAKAVATTPGDLTLGAVANVVQAETISVIAVDS